MKTCVFFVALFAATDAWKTVEVAEPTFGSRFTSIKEEADRFSAACRDVLNGEGPTFTIDVSDHSLGDGVGEEALVRSCSAAALLLFALLLLPICVLVKICSCFVINECFAHEMKSKQHAPTQQ